LVQSGQTQSKKQMQNKRTKLDLMRSTAQNGVMCCTVQYINDSCQSAQNDNFAHVD